MIDAELLEEKLALLEGLDEYEVEMTPEEAEALGAFHEAALAG